MYIKSFCAVILSTTFIVASCFAKRPLDVPIEPTNKNHEIVSVETFVVDSFQEFCINNIEDLDKTKHTVEVLGFPKEKNELLNPNYRENRWIVYKNDKKRIRVNLTLLGKSCMISAIINKDGPISFSDEQTPIEYFLMEKLGSELINTQESDTELARLYDANHLGIPANIVLRNIISPSTEKAGSHFYEVTLTITPRK